MSAPEHSPAPILDPSVSSSDRAQEVTRLRESHAILLSAAKASFPVMATLIRQYVRWSDVDYEPDCKVLDALQAAIFQARDIES
jgi:hypothetical protein